MKHQALLSLKKKQIIKQMSAAVAFYITYMIKDSISKCCLLNTYPVCLGSSCIFVLINAKKCTSKVLFYLCSLFVSLYLQAIFFDMNKTFVFKNKCHLCLYSCSATITVASSILNLPASPRQISAKSIEDSNSLSDSDQSSCDQTSCHKSWSSGW